MAILILDPDPKIYSSWKIRIFLVLIHGNASLHCIIFLISVIGVIIFRNLDSILKLTGKFFSYLSIWLKWIQIRIRIGRPWIPIPIRQNNADPNGSGFGSGVIIFRNLDSILKLTGKFFSNLSIWLKWIQIRIRIGRP
jgi:hypothetical protein